MYINKYENTYKKQTFKIIYTYQCGLFRGTADILIEVNHININRNHMI